MIIIFEIVWQAFTGSDNDIYYRLKLLDILFIVDTPLRVLGEICSDNSSKSIRIADNKP